MNKKVLYILILLFCILCINTVKADWEQIDIPNPYYYNSGYSLTDAPTSPLYAFSSSANGYGYDISIAAIHAYTYANYDGKYIGDPVDPSDPDPPDTSDQLDAVTGTANAVAQTIECFEGYGPLCTTNQMIVEGGISGDADNGSLSAGTCSITSAATAEIVCCIISNSNYLDRWVTFSGVKTYTESISWSSAGLSLSLSGASLSLGWDDIAFWDDDFSSLVYKLEAFDPFFIEPFYISYNADASASATSSNNAMNACVYLTATAQPTYTWQDDI